MVSTKNKEDLLYIEKCFAAIKNNVNISENLTKISNALKRLFDINCNLTIISNTTNTFFGMNVYPSVSTMDLIVESIVNNESKSDDVMNLWKKNKDWSIEIDSILLYDNNLNANPQELTAVLLHEIGHIVYTNSVPQRLYKILKVKFAKLSFQMRELIANEKIRKMLNITILQSCNTKNYRYINSDVETTADKFAIYYGYGDHLNTFIDKLIRTQGNSLVNRTDDEVEKDILTVVNWTVINLKELEFRKSALRNNLKIEILKNPSLLYRKVVQDIYNSFFGEATDKYREILSEQAGYKTDKVTEMIQDQNLQRLVNRILKEAGTNVLDRHGNIKKITQLDIDILYAESEKIETLDDKIYLLDKTYNLSEIVNTGLDYIDSHEKELSSKVTQSKRTLQDMKTQLEEIRKSILATKIIEKEYGVFIKYPKGYTG